MAGENVDPKVDSTPVDIKYEDIPEKTRKQFEPAFQKEQEEAKKRLLACFGKTRQDVFKKEEFKMPTFTPPPNPSTMATAAASSASTPSEVSFTFDSIKQFADAFLSRFEQSQKLTQDILMDLSMQNKGKKIVNDYSNFPPNPRPHYQRIISMVCRAQFGRPGPNRSDRSSRPVRPVPRRADRSNRPIRPVRPVPSCSVLRHSHHSRLFLLR